MGQKGHCRGFSSAGHCLRSGCSIYQPVRPEVYPLGSPQDEDQQDEDLFGPELPQDFWDGMDADKEEGPQRKRVRFNEFGGSHEEGGSMSSASGGPAGADQSHAEGVRGGAPEHGGENEEHGHPDVKAAVDPRMPTRQDKRSFML